MVTLNLVDVTAATAALSFSSVKTNDDIAVNNNSVKFINPGMYEIIGDVSVQSTAATGNYGVYLSVNGEQHGNMSVATSSSAASKIVTVPVYDTLEVIPSETDGYVKLELIPVGSPDVLGGTVSIKKII